MAGLFISHSSIDKPFVNRLAIGLVARGMPVWFDTWQIGTGDSLQHKIYEGIGASDYLIVVLSPNSVVSGWVQKELAAALTLEERQGRKFVLPIRIAECEIPLAIEDRLYADFSASYLEPLERLVAELRRLGVDGINEPPEHALLPLVFEKGIYLDGVQLERDLIEGIRLIVNGYIATKFPRFDVGVASHWLARDIRSEILYLLWSTQNPDLPDVIDYGKDCEPSPFMTNSTAAEFLEVKAVEYIDIGPENKDYQGTFAQLADSVAIAIEADSAEYRAISDALICSIHNIGGSHLYSKYLIPQLVARHLSDPDSPFTLTFDDWYVGLH